MARPFDPRHRHWWLLPTPGDTDLTCAAVGRPSRSGTSIRLTPLRIPLCAGRGNRARWSARRSALHSPLSRKIRQDSRAQQHRTEHRT